MKVKIVIQTRDKETGYRRTSEVWSGELELMDDSEYLAKVSIIGEDKPEPICDIPFAIGIGYYLWIPPSNEMDERDEGWNLAN